MCVRHQKIYNNLKIKTGNDLDYRRWRLFILEAQAQFFLYCFEMMDPLRFGASITSRDGQCYLQKYKLDQSGSKLSHSIMFNSVIISAFACCNVPLLQPFSGYPFRTNWDSLGFFTCNSICHGGHNTLTLPTCVMAISRKFHSNSLVGLSKDFWSYLV